MKKSKINKNVKLWRRFYTVCMCMILFSSLDSVVGQQLLRDRDFEISDPNGGFPNSGAWSKAWLGEGGGIVTTTAGRNGSNGLWEFTGVSGSDWWSGQFQELAASEGQRFVAFADIRTPKGEKWVNGAFAQVRILFLSANGSVLATYSSDSVTESDVNWASYQVESDPAPRGTVAVRFVCYLEKPQAKTGIAVANFDNCGLIRDREGIPEIVFHPLDIIVAPGENALLSVRVIGTKPISIQWMKDGQPVVSGDGLTLSLINISSDDSGDYTVIASNKFGRKTSQPARVTFFESNAPILLFTNIPRYNSKDNICGKVLNIDSSEYRVALYILVAGRWWTKPTFSDSTVSIQDTGQWCADITTGGIDERATRITAFLLPTGIVPPRAGGTGSLKLSELRRNALAEYTVDRLTNGQLLLPPTVLRGPVDQEKPKGADVEFSVNVDGRNTNLSYQWFFGGNVISGATTSVLRLKSINSRSFGRYYCVVTNNKGESVATSALLSIKEQETIPPTILIQPRNEEIFVGDSTMLSVEAVGGRPLSYQWYFEGRKIIGATSPAISLINVNKENAGNYYVIIENSAKAIKSENAALIVQERPEIELYTVPTIGSFENLTGKVVGSGIDGFKVVCHVFVEGLGWFSKPSCTNAVTTLDMNGEFEVDVTTGGIDEMASIIRIDVIRTDDNISCLDSAPCIPSFIEDHSLQSVIVKRSGPDQKTLTFSGEQWIVKSSSVLVGPGPNLFNEENAKVDEGGKMHLRISHNEGRWECAEVISQRSFGYGTYTFVTESNLDFDPSIVFGGFTWSSGDCPPNSEIDVEISKFGNPNSNEFAQYVVQPFGSPGNLFKFSLPFSETVLTHSMLWTPDAIQFSTTVGDLRNLLNPDVAIVKNWRYANRSAIPKPGSEKFRFNFWLFDGKSPVDGVSHEVVIRNFDFVPLNRPRLSIGRVGDGRLILAWPAQAVDEFVVEVSDSVENEFSNIRLLVHYDGVHARAFVESARQSQYYRLRQSW